MIFSTSFLSSKALLIELGDFLVLRGDYSGAMAKLYEAEELSSTGRNVNAYIMYFQLLM